MSSDISLWTAAIAVGGTALGGVIGGFSSYFIARNSNKNAKDLATEERKAAATQAKDERDHAVAMAQAERDHTVALETLRAVRASREATYAPVASIVQLGNTELYQLATGAMAGHFGSAVWTMDSPESRVLWGRMAVHASEKTAEAWELFLTASGDVVRKVEAARVAQNEVDQRRGAQVSVLMALSDLEKARSVLQERVRSLLQEMRTDLGSGTLTPVDKLLTSAASPTEPPASG